MKKIIKLALAVLIFCNHSVLFAQQKEGGTRYWINSSKASQDTVFFTKKTKALRLKMGATATETVSGKTYTRALESDTTILLPEDLPFVIPGKWYASEVKHTNDHPDKLFLNPGVFTSSELAHFNDQCYIKIPGNSYVRLKRTFNRWAAITIPFAYRPALNDSIGSKVTTDLKAGISFSKNINWETFKNRRIQVEKSIYGVSFGVAGGFSKVTLDEKSTSLSENPLLEAEDGLAFFLAPGVNFNIRGFQAGVFIGWDFGLTDNVKSWNYNRKAYLGLALGIGLETLFNN